MEQLLHYVWKHKIFPLSLLQTTSGRPVEVIDPGLPNMNAGPDFFNAKLKIDGTLWVGNVEVHTQASDWLLHRHDRDKAYDTVIHSIRYDSEADSITITHDAKNRRGFALGAVLAAEYTAKHEGALGMSDLFPFLKD